MWHRSHLWVPIHCPLLHFCLAALDTQGALRHADALASPVNLQVVMGKPQVSNDDGLLPEVCNCEACLLHVLAISECDLDLLCNGSILVQSSINIVDWDWVW